MRKHQLVAPPHAPTPHPFDLREGMKRWSVLGNEERLEILEPIYDKLQFMDKVLRSGFVQTFVPLVVFLLIVWAVSIWSHPFVDRCRWVSRVASVRLFWKCLHLFG